MRVTAGNFKSRSVKVVDRPGLRPTSAMVREAVFNVPAVSCCEARVLDLFAGSGIMGIEFLSRGADLVVFVDSDRRAIRQLRTNLASLGVARERWRVVNADAGAALRRLHGEGAVFDVVFMDPPYRKDLTVATLDKLAALPELLTPEALVICEVERDARCCATTGVMFQEFRRRAYGDTDIVMFDSQP